MRNILISIKPEHCCNILNKDKILEIRTTCPMEWKKYLDGKTSIKPEPCKVSIYCTNGKLLYKSIESNEYLEYYSLEYWNETDTKINGKVIAEFTLNEIDKIEICDPYIFRNNEQEDWKYFEKNACLTCEQMMEYIGYGEDHDGWDKKYDIGYAWHIDDLITYDKPKELSEFSKHGFESLCGSSICGNSSCPFYLDSNSYDLPPECLCEKQCQIKSPPQSWCYVMN